MKHSIFDAEQVEVFRKEMKLEPYRLKQIYDNIFKQSMISFDEMTNLSLELREAFAGKFQIVPLVLDKLVEDDETSKFLFATSTGEVMESVLMYHYHTKSDAE
jgi:23S rRNA (adenine2503-C2)-methyltransferase